MSLKSFNMNFFLNLNVHFDRKMDHILCDWILIGSFRDTIIKSFVYVDEKERTGIFVSDNELSVIINRVQRLKYCHNNRIKITNHIWFVKYHNKLWPSYLHFQFVEPSDSVIRYFVQIVDVACEAMEVALA